MRLRYGDRFRLIPLRTWEIKSQDPVVVFGLDAVRVDFDREGHRPIKAPGQSLTAMNTGLFAIFHRLGAGKVDRSALDLDL